jgi:hypothetical protein
MLKKVVVALVVCVVTLTAGPALGITYGEPTATVIPPSAQ